MQGLGVGAPAGLVGQLLDPHGRRVQQLVDDPAHRALELGAACRGSRPGGARRAGPARRRRPRRPSARSATTVGATRAACRCGEVRARPRRPTIARTASTSRRRPRPRRAARPSVVEVDQGDAGQAEHGRVDVVRAARGRGRPAAGRRARPAPAATASAVSTSPVGAGAGDDQVGLGAARPSSVVEAARPGRRPASASRGGPLRRRGWRRRRRRRRRAPATATASALIEPAPTTSARPPGQPAERVGREVEADRTSDRAPARSMPVSVCTRLPTRSAGWTRSLSARPAVPASCAVRSASRTWPRICASPTTIESSPQATWNRCCDRARPRSARRGAAPSSSTGTPAAAASSAVSVVDAAVEPRGRRRRPRPGCRWTAPAASATCGERRDGRRAAARQVVGADRGAARAGDRRGPVDRPTDDEAHPTASPRRGRAPPAGASSCLRCSWKARICSSMARSTLRTSTPSGTVQHAPARS